MMLPADPEQRHQALNDIIQPLSQPRYVVDVSLHSLERQLEGFANDYGLNLEPDFQRGHVWNDEQRQSFMEGLLRGTVNRSINIIQFNSPSWGEVDDPASDLPSELQIVDGLQRLTTLRQFMAGQIKPFGLVADDLKGSAFDPRRSTMGVKFAVHAFKTRNELLNYYLMINSGGTPHDERELNRVRQLLNDAGTSSSSRPMPSRTCHLG